jgi:hypothetical protein
MNSPRLRTQVLLDLSFKMRRSRPAAHSSKVSPLALVYREPQVVDHELKSPATNRGRERRCLANSHTSSRNLSKQGRDQEDEALHPTTCRAPHSMTTNPRPLPIVEMGGECGVCHLTTAIEP